MITELNNEAIDAVTGGCFFLAIPYGVIVAAAEAAKAASEKAEAE